MAKLVRQCALFVDQAQNFRAALFHAAQSLELFGEYAQRLIVHGTGQLLAIARDKGNGLAVIQQVDDVLYMNRGKGQLFRKNGYDVHCVLNSPSKNEYELL